jgi:hypothetical protein
VITATRRRILLGVVLVVVVTAVMAGFMIAGSPAQARLERLDERRVQDLSLVRESVNIYWNRHSSLPATLADAAGDSGLPPIPTDPTTKQAYGYRVTGPKTFELCAEFQARSGDATVWRDAGYWGHGIGRHCFSREVRTP